MLLRCHWEERGTERQQPVNVDARSEIEVIRSFGCSTHSFVQGWDAFIKLEALFIQLGLKLSLTGNFKHNGKK